MARMKQWSDRQKYALLGFVLGALTVAVVAGLIG